MTVIDSLGKGFETVLRCWWLILIPVLLDAFLWLGPRASVQDLMQQTVEVLEAELADAPSDEAVDWMAPLHTFVDQVLPRYNAFTALRVGTTGIPSLLTWGGARLGSPSVYEALWVFFLGIADLPDLLVSVSEADFVQPQVWQIQGEGTWLLVTLGLTLAGIALGSVYLASISRSVSGSQESAPLWPGAAQLGGRVALFWVLRAVVLVVLGLPFLLTMWLLSMLSPALALLFTTVMLGMATWLAFYGIFFVAALVMNRTSIWQALWNSFSVVLRNFWPTLWLFILINLIGGGMTILWQRLSTGSWWTLLAILGNAYVGTSLVAASMAFYQERYTRWRQALAEVLAQQGKRTA